MESKTLGQEVVTQLMQLMERSGLEAIAPPVFSAEKDITSFLEATLTNLKHLNAKYDKNEAIHQIKCLMDKYNIQLDQLVDGRGMG